MFKNLKKRVEQEGGEGLLTAVATGTISGFKSPHSSIRSTSHESLSEIGDRRMSVSSTATPIPEETSVDELMQKISRLRTALDRQQTGFDRRLKKTDEDWEEKLRQVEASWHTKYDVLKENMSAVLDKNARLEEEWPSLEARAKDGEGFKEKLILLQDELDTMQGLQNQEIAKVKHLLIQKEKEFVESEGKVKELETALSQARKESELITKDLENYRSSQRSCSELQDRCDALQFQLDASESKRTKEASENKAIVSELREKVSTLEQRLGSAELGDDARVHALQLERAGLEKKLEETREQLTNVKSTWSSKIDSLERQISHLNSSKAEESAENAKLADSLRSSEEEKEQLKAELVVIAEKVKTLESDKEESNSELARLKEMESRLASVQSELQNAKSAESSLKTEVASLNIVVNELKPYKVRAENAESSLSNLQQQVVSLKEIESHLSAAKQENEKLRSCQSELSKTLKKHEEDLAVVKTEAERLKPFEEASKMAQEKLEKVEAKVKALEASVEESQVKLVSLEAVEKDVVLLKDRSENLEQELAEATKRVSELDSANNDMQQKSNELENERDQMMMRNAEVSQALELSKRTQRDYEDKCKAAEAEVAKLKARLADAENWSEDRVEKLDAMIKVRQTVDLLEEQLVEKNKTIRLQNQRINDIKKALQKELNSRANGAKQISMGDSSSEESGYYQPNANFPRSEPALPPPTLAVTSQDDVNFTYMKNVVLHVLTSKGAEALHMTKALATVLKLSGEEERLVKDTLEWRLSWFGQKPEFHKLL